MTTTNKHRGENMKSVKTVIKYRAKIMDYLSDHPGQYITIDDMTIDLLVNKRNENYERAWRELIVAGQIESIGNAVRVNQ